MDRGEAQKIVEITLQNLLNSGFVKIANKEAQSLFEERLNDKEPMWGLPDMHFVITAAGAKRIGWLVGNLTSVQYADVAKNLQAESKAAAAEWLVAYKAQQKEIAAIDTIEAKKAAKAKKTASRKPVVATAIAAKKPVVVKKGFCEGSYQTQERRRSRFAS
ncbi:hypothetical protein PQR63_19470 [Herbaspirillum rhizosphaerae]|uniref:Uncharacterized protein n=1 Tax=Herbaspirillum rhizosphaerae TaxID=346179 RepID=A0ABW8ZCS7_9BURK